MNKEYRDGLVDCLGKEIFEHIKMVLSSIKELHILLYFSMKYHYAKLFIYL